MALLAKEQLQVARDVAAGHVHARDGVLHGKALVHGHGVRDAVAAVEHGARRAARGVAGRGRVRRQNGCALRATQRQKGAAGAAAPLLSAGIFLQAEDGLHGHKQRRHVHGLEEDLCREGAIQR